MTSTHDTGITADSAPSRTGGPRRIGRLVATGLLATVAAMVATTLVAALARAGGVDFEIRDGAEHIPLSGVTVVTGFFSLVGVVIAATLLRWSSRPAEVFLRTTVALTALSFVPSLLAGADVATTCTLLALHLVAAAVMIPALTRSLRGRRGLG